jgi:uncharacterized RDD family membrane protein YckC
MKCPKCGYLGFERVDRCRNCGYDFSLSSPLNLPELPIRSAEGEKRVLLDDLTLAEPPRAERPPWQAAADLQQGSGSAAGAASDLPLFVSELVDDRPLITKPSPPRAPLAVRRATPEVPRLRAERSRAPLLDLSGSASSGAVVVETRGGNRAFAGGAAGMEPAGILARGVAVVIDLLILAAVDVVVIYFTMQIGGLTPDDVSILPKGPLIGFLLVQNGGYLVAFTLGGQTMGKMATGIKIVSAGDGRPIDLGHSLIRTMVWALLAIPAGLGFVTALFSRERRGLHDHCAGTRVIRAA